LAFVVVVDHLRIWVLAPAGLSTQPYYQLGMNAGFAVMFFYIISGFLISTALEYKYPFTMTRTIDFYKSRFVRIFSLYWPMVLVTLAVLPTAREEFLSNSIADKFTNIFLVGIEWRISFTGTSEHWNAALYGLYQAWTLGAELIFYSVAPFLLRSRTAALSVFFLSLATRAVCVYLVGFEARWTYLFLPSTFLFFLLGHFARSAADRWPQMKAPATGLAFLAASIAILLADTTSYVTWDSLRFCFAVLFFSMAIPGIFQATKDNSVLNLLGDLSFPVYLVHLLLIIVGVDLGLFRILPLFGPVVVLTTLAVTLVAAAAAHWLLEQPTARLLRWSLDVVFNRPKQVPKTAAF